MATEDLSNHLPRIATGKVRDLYAIDGDTLLFVASDRISAFDVVLESTIPEKGRVLTLLSEFWFEELSSAIVGLRHHFLGVSVPAEIPADLHARLRDRSMRVRRLRVLPVEAIVRGYLSGSAWAEYTKSGTVHGTPMPPGLRESEKLPGGAIYTPSTKAKPGQHDENISVERAAEIIGDPDVARRVADLAVSLYEVAAGIAAKRGIIIADTKFEFGIDDATGQVVLVDEVLTPDSSRFWAADKYEVGRAQDSYDKQRLRDWLTREGLKGKQGVKIPEDVVADTAARYRDVYEKLTGKKFESS